MSATDLLRLSYYGFTATSLAVVAAVAFYASDLLWLIRSAQPAVAGGALASWRAYAMPPTPVGSVASSAVVIATLFAGFAVVLRALATGRGPYSDMYEFSVAFVFVALLGYVLLERSYGVRPMGVIALPVIFGMIVYVWSLPPSVREDRGLIPALSSKPILTAHVSVAIVAHAAPWRLRRRVAINF